MSTLHKFNNNVKGILRDLADSDFKATGYYIYLGVAAARQGVSVQTNKSGVGEGMKGMTGFMRDHEVPDTRKGNLSKSAWIVWTLIPHVVTAADDDVRDIVEAFVGDRSLDDLYAECQAARGIEKVKAEDTLDKILANLTVRVEAIGYSVEVDVIGGRTVVTLVNQSW